MAAGRGSERLRFHFGKNIIDDELKQSELSGTTELIFTKTNY